jgi:hypothetical protein
MKCDNSDQAAYEASVRILSYPCHQVQDVEFTRYDTDTVLHFVVFASLLYVRYEVDRNSLITNSHQGA